MATVSWYKNKIAPSVRTNPSQNNQLFKQRHKDPIKETQNIYSKSY